MKTEMSLWISLTLKGGCLEQPCTEKFEEQQSGLQALEKLSDEELLRDDQIVDPIQHLQCKSPEVVCSALWALTNPTHGHVLPGRSEYG